MNVFRVVWIIAQNEVVLARENAEVLKTGEVVEVDWSRDDKRIIRGSRTLLEVGTK
jgi:hypothetical protein